MRPLSRFHVLLASPVLAICGVMSATPGEMFPIDIILTADYTVTCVNHVDEDGNAWFIADIANIHPDLPPRPFEQGFQFRVTGQYCLACVDTFCGSFAGFIFSANLVPVVDGDVNADGAADILDLIDLLLCFGQPADPGCESKDLNGDETVNVLDLVDLLVVFGTASP